MLFKPFPVEKLFSDFFLIFEIFLLIFFYDLLLLGSLSPFQNSPIPHGSPIVVNYKK